MTGHGQSLKSISGLDSGRKYVKTCEQSSARWKQGKIWIQARPFVRHAAGTDRPLLPGHSGAAGEIEKLKRMLSSDDIRRPTDD